MIKIGQKLVANDDFRVSEDDDRTLTRGHTYMVSSVDDNYCQFAVRSDIGSEIYFDNDEVDIYFD